MDGERRKAFFLDRDGVILKVRYLEPYPPETPDDKIVSKLVTIDQVQILPGVAAALKRIHDRGFLAIVTEGDALADITTSHGGALHKYCTVYTQFRPRPKDSYNLAESISIGSNATWTVERAGAVPAIPIGMPRWKTMWSE